MAEESYDTWEKSEWGADKYLYARLGFLICTRAFMNSTELLKDIIVGPQNSNRESQAIRTSLRKHSKAEKKLFFNSNKKVTWVSKIIIDLEGYSKEKILRNF